MFGRKEKNIEEKPADGVQDPRLTSETDRTLAASEGNNGPTKQQIKRATRTRLYWSLLSSFLLLITVIFLILVELGQTNSKSAIRNSIYFINLNLTNIIPDSDPDSTIINSIAQSLGLHDFYRVGLWGFCEGYNDSGTSDCSTPKTLYWFDPVAIILNELLSGATITLPAEITSILDILKVVSKWMFGIFLSGACLSFVMIFITPLSVFSRWAAFFISIFTFLAALLVTVGAVIATILFIVIRDAITSVTEINIGASLGTKMFAFMWIAAACSILAWLIQMGECCCCASRRDVRTGRKKGSKKAWNTETIGVSDSNSEKPKRSGIFSRKTKS